MGLKISEETTYFNQFGVTDYFIYDGILYMKTEAVEVEGEGIKNVVSLFDGSLWFMEDDERVKRVEIEMSARFILNKD